MVPFLRSLALVTALLLASCANQQQVPASPDILRVGVTPNSPPVIFKSGGQYQGLDADLARSLAAEMGRTPQFIERKWDRLLPSLQAGEIDIVMSNMTITPERQSYAQFTSPYLEVGQMILVRAGEILFYQDPRVLAFVDKRIGVEEGTVSDTFVQRYCPKATRVGLKDPSQAIDALASGKIDAFVHDAPVIWQLSGPAAAKGVAMVPTPIGAESLGWAVRRGDTATLNKANAALKKWKGNGQLAKMVNRWVPTRR